jgi:hypothetical protein
MATALSYESQRGTVPPLDVALPAPVHRPPPRWRRNAFISGFCAHLFVKLIGYMSFLEVYFLASAPFKVRELLASAGRNPTMIIFTLLWVMWCIATVAADIVNQNRFDLMARGIARSFFHGFLVLSFFRIWLPNHRKIEYFLAGYPFSLLLSRYIFRDGSETVREMFGTELDWNWKSETNYYVSAALFALTARYYRRSPLGVAGLCAITGVINMAMGSRSGGISQVLAAGLMLVFSGRVNAQNTLAELLRQRRQVFSRIMLGGAMALAVTGIGYQTFGYAAREGILGQAERKKLEDQENVSGGVLVGGRFGFFVGLWAVAHKPILGHGSWPLDVYGYTLQTADYLGADSRDIRLAAKRIHWIPAHSAIIGGWVEHGIAGFLFWLFVLYLLIVNFPRAAVVFPEYAGLYALIASGFGWSIFFSPGGHRGWAAMNIVSFLLVDDAWRRMFKTSPARQSLPDSPPMAASASSETQSFASPDTLR